MSDFQDICRRTRGLRIKLATSLGLHKSAVYQWRRVPAERVIDVERLTGIPREVLRPDLYRHSKTKGAA